MSRLALFLFLPPLFAAVAAAAAALLFPALDLRCSVSGRRREGSVRSLEISRSRQRTVCRTQFHLKQTVRAGARTGGGERTRLQVGVTN